MSDITKAEAIEKIDKIMNEVCKSCEYWNLRLDDAPCDECFTLAKEMFPFWKRRKDNECV